MTRLKRDILDRLLLLHKAAVFLTEDELIKAIADLADHVRQIKEDNDNDEQAEVDQ
jgi:predicted oxidoreductase